MDATDLTFERREQSQAAKDWLRAAMSGNVERMKELVKEDPSVVGATDTFVGCVKWIRQGRDFYSHCC